MNAKRAKKIRQRLRASGYDETDNASTSQPLQQRTLVPDCGRSICRRLKQLGID